LSTGVHEFHVGSDPMQRPWRRQSILRRVSGVFGHVHRGRSLRHGRVHPASRNLCRVYQTTDNAFDTGGRDHVPSRVCGFRDRGHQRRREGGQPTAWSSAKVRHQPHRSLSHRAMDAHAYRRSLPARCRRESFVLFVLSWILFTLSAGAFYKSEEVQPVGTR
jgi:hypothetical protein